LRNKTTPFITFFEIETMAHMIRNSDGILTIGERPWHGLGVTLAEPPATALEALRLAGMDWEVEKQPMFLKDSRPVHIVGGTKSENGYWGTIIRQDTDEQLGVVGPGYHPLQNRQLASIFEPLVASGKIQIETCGSLQDGRKVWMLAKLQGSEKIRGVGENDEVAKYWMIAHGHDGKMAARIGFTPIRVVCWNTLSAAVGSAASSLVKCLHTQSLSDNLETLMTAMDATDELFHLSCEQYRQLSAKGVSRSDLQEYARIVVDAPKDVNEWSKHDSKKVWQIVEAATQGVGNLGSSWWDAYNGVTEVLSWRASKTKNTRLDSLWFGNNHNVNQDALNLALTMAS